MSNADEVCKIAFIACFKQALELAFVGRIDITISVFSSIVHRTFIQSTTTALWRKNVFSILRRVCLALFAVIWIGGCATTKEIRSDLPLSETGTAIVSLGSYGKLFASSHRLEVRNVETREVTSFFYLQENLFKPAARDFDGPDENGAVFAKNLPPGKYELYNFSTFRNGYPSTQTLSSKEDFKIPFTVEKGKGVYLGRYLASEVFGRSLIGMRVTAFIYFLVRDESEKDLPVAKKKFPHLASQPIEKQVADPIAVGHPLIQSKLLPADLPR